MALKDHLDKLESFRIVCELGTLSEAATRLHVSQPGLTRLIQTLEETTGEELLYRSRAGVKPTAAGQLLLDYAQRILAELDGLESQMKVPENPLSGHLKIGSYESLAEYLWPDLIHDLRKEVPELKISLSTSSIADPLQGLKQGVLDALVDAEPRVTGDFTSWKIYQDRFQFFRVYGNTKQSVEIGNQPLIFCPLAFDSGNRTILDHIADLKMEFAEKIALDSFTAVRNFCRKGTGIAVLPQRLAKESVLKKEIEAFPGNSILGKSFGPHDICLTVRSHRAKDPKIVYLAKTVRQHFKNI